MTQDLLQGKIRAIATTADFTLDDHDVEDIATYIIASHTDDVFEVVNQFISDKINYSSTRWIYET